MRTLSTEDLIDAVSVHGVRVRWHHKGPKGAWRPGPKPKISLRHGMTDAETISALAHEIGHAASGDVCGHNPVREARAWRFAADLLIDPEDYECAERVYGPAIPLLAHELDVTTEVVCAWQTAYSDLRRTAS